MQKLLPRVRCSNNKKSKISIYNNKSKTDINCIYNLNINKYIYIHIKFGTHLFPLCAKLGTK